MSKKQSASSQNSSQAQPSLDQLRTVKSPKNPLIVRHQSIEVACAKRVRSLIPAGLRA
ncbi:MAG: hypothetical protein AAF171_00250 [Cyanobacteria bacterium P01_A01_bin.116]